MMQTLNQLSAELLPCPFCGREAHIIERVTGPNGPGFFCAVSCYCGGYSAKAHQSATSNNDQMARVEAINRWNHRTGQLVAVSDDAMAMRLETSLVVQMEAQADDNTPSSIHQDQGCVWLEGWFDLKQALAAMKDPQP